MLSWLQGRWSGLANVALALTMIKVLTDMLAAWLGPQYQKRLEEFLQRSQHALTSSSDRFALAAPLVGLSRFYERLLGRRPFSRQAFWRTCLFGALFLGASLGVAGLFCGKPFAMDLPPWKSFFASLDYLQLLGKNEQIRSTGGPLFVAQNASDLATFRNWPCAVLFSIYFIVVVVGLTAFLISLTTAVSRLFLREMIIAKSVFRLSLLFFSSTALALGVGGGATLVLFVLVNVWTWPLVPLFFVVSQATVAGGLGLASAASLASWFFSAPWLRVVVGLSVLPSILIVGVTGVTLLAFPFRRQLNAAAAGLINRGLKSPKGIFSFLSASSAALALVLTALASFLGWLAKLSLGLGSFSMLGLDSVTFSFFLFVCMLLLSLARSTRSAVARTEVVFLFFGGLCAIVIGFYIQAILECFFNVKSAGIPSPLTTTLAMPLISGIVPGSMVGSILVFARISDRKWALTALRIFVALAGWDVLLGLRALVSYHDVVFSLVCDGAGAPVAALLLVGSRYRLFAESRAANPEMRTLPKPGRDERRVLRPILPNNESAGSE